MGQGPGLGELQAAGWEQEERREEDGEEWKWAGPGTSLTACSQAEIPVGPPGSSRTIWGSPG